eukprot:CFRG3199T1
MGYGDSVQAKPLNLDPRKGKNRFKFQSFADQISNVKINVAHRVGVASELPQDRESFFLEELEKWRELNCTQHFTNCVVKVLPLVASFNLLVYNQEKVLNLLLEHLQIEDSLAIEPLLILLTALARDLRQEFTQYFDIVLQTLVILLNDTRDVKKIQQTFTCLTYLFKYLSKYLIVDLENVFVAYTQLLVASQPDHVRTFASESFGFLLRKITDMDRLAFVVNSMLTQGHVHNNQTFANSVGALLFEVVKGTGTRFHSRAPQIYAMYLALLQSSLTMPTRTRASMQAAQDMQSIVDSNMEVDEDMHSKAGTNDEQVEINEWKFTVMKHLSSLMAEHTRREHCAHVWECLYKALSDCQSEWTNKGKDTNFVVVATAWRQTIELLTLWTNHRRGARVVDMELLYKTFHSYFVMVDGVNVMEHLPSVVVKAASSLLVALLKVDARENALVKGPVLLKGVFSTCNDSLVRDVMLELRTLPIYTQLCLASLVEYFNNTLTFTIPVSSHDSQLLSQASKKKAKPSANFTVTSTPSHNRSEGMDRLVLMHALFETLDLTRSASVAVSKNHLIRFPTKSTPVQAAHRNSKKTENADTSSFIPVPFRLLAHVQNVISRTCVNMIDDDAKILSPTTAEKASVCVALACLDRIEITSDAAESVVCVLQELLTSLTQLAALTKPCTDVNVPSNEQHTSTSIHSHANANEAYADVVVDKTDEWVYLMLAKVMQTLKHVCITCTNVASMIVVHELMRVAVVTAPAAWPVLEAYAAYCTSLKELNGEGNNKEIDNILSTENMYVMYEVLKKNFTSPLRERRKWTAQVLISYKQPRLNQSTADDTTISPECELFAYIFEAEDMSLTVTDFRQFIAIVNRCSTLSKYNRLPVQLKDCVILYGFGLLHVPMKMVWEAGFEILREEARRDHATFWTLFLSQLNLATQQNNTGCTHAHEYVPTSTSAHVNTRTDIDLVRIVREMYATTSAIPTTYHNKKWASTGKFNRKHDEKKPRNTTTVTSTCDSMQIIHSHTDYLHFHSLLLKTISGAASDVVAVAERHARDIISVFLMFIDCEYRTAYVGTAATQNLTLGSTDSDVIDEDGIGNADMNVRVVSSVEAQNMKKSVLTRLIDYLRLLSVFINPKSHYQSDRLRALYVEFVAKTDPTVQKHALECLLTFKPPYLMPQKELLLDMCDDAKFREALSMVVLEEGRDGEDEVVGKHVGQNVAVVPAEHRTDFLNILVRILFAHMMRRKGSGTGKNSLHVRRHIVLAFLAGLRSDELKVFIDFMHARFGEDFLRKERDCDATHVVPLSAQAGYLHLVVDVMKQLRLLIVPYLGQMDSVMVRMAGSASELLERQRAENQPAVESAAIHPKFIATLRSLRMNAIQALEIAYTIFPSHYEIHNQIQSELFSTVILPRINRLAAESLQTTNGLLDLFAVWSGHETQYCLLVKDGDVILPNVFALLSANTVAPDVVKRVYDIVENLLDRQKAEDLVVESEDVMKTDTDNDKITGKDLVLAATGTSAGDIIRIHVSTLLKHMHTALLSSKTQTIAPIETRPNGIPLVSKGNAKRKRGTERELSILSRISIYADEEETASRLLVLLSPCLKQPRREVNDKAKLHVLKIIAHCIRVVSDIEPNQLSFFSQLFATLSSDAHRLALASCYIELSQKHTGLGLDLAPVAGLLVRLNALDEERVDEPDYEVRLGAAMEFNEKMVFEMPLLALLPVTQHFIHVINTTQDTSLRFGATHGLAQIAARCHKDISIGNYETHAELITRVIFPAMKKCFRYGTEISRSEFVLLLQKLILLFSHKNNPESNYKVNDSYLDLEVLSTANPNDEDDADFFTNIRHIQLHRRIRALTRLNDVIESGVITQTSLVNILLPLVGHVVVDNTKLSEHHYVNAAVDVIGSISGHLSWGHYIYTLRRYLKMAATKPELEKALLKVVTIIVERFHFTAVEEPLALDVSIEADDLDISNENDSAGVPSDSQASPTIVPSAMVANELEVPAMPSGPLTLEQRISSTVERAVLPEMNRYLIKKDKDGGDVLRPAIALATVGLLKTMPQLVMDKHLPGLITKVCFVLRSRDDVVREDAREALIDISITLGPVYLPFVLKELMAQLRTGYKLHILGYTTHALLAKFIEAHDGEGAIDEAVQVVLDVIVPDIFGLTGQEKEVMQILTKMKEAKAKRGYDTFELVAKNVSFKYIQSTLMPIRDIMASTESLKTRRMVEEVFRRIVIGLTNNPTANVPDVLLLVHGLLTENVSLSQMATKESVKKSRRDANMEVVRERGKVAQRSHEYYLQTNAHLFIEFGLSLMHANLKRGYIDARKPGEHQRMMDPIVSVLGDALRSKYDKIVMLSLKCLSYCFRFELPVLEKSVPHIANRCFKILNRAGVGATGAELHQACFKMLTTIVRDYKSYEISEAQLRHLIDLCRTDLEVYEKQASTYAMVRAIIGRKTLLPEIYTLVDNIADIMVRGDIPSVRSHCTTIFISFLMEYPLGAKLLQKWIKFCLKNLEYEFAHGRESMLEVIHKMVDCFPDEVLAEYVQVIYLPLVMRLINDDSSVCKEMASTIIKRLVARATAEQRDILYNKMVMAWLNTYKSKVNANAMLVRCGLQVTGLFAEALGTGFDRYASDVLPILRLIITTNPDDYIDELAISSNMISSKRRANTGIEAESEDEGESEEAEDYDDAPDEGRLDGNDVLAWPILYYATTALEKILDAVPTLLSPAVIASNPTPVPSTKKNKKNKVVALSDSRVVVDTMWKDIHTHMLHPHVWVRLVTSRLLGKYLSTVGSDPVIIASGLLRIRDDGESVDSKNVNSLLENENSVWDIARTCCKQLESKHLISAMGTQVVKNLFYVTRVLHILEEQTVDPKISFTHIVKSKQLKRNNDENGGEDDEGNEGETRRILWICKRLAYVARNTVVHDARLSALRRKCVFEYFAAMTNIASAQTLKPLLTTIILPVVSVNEDRRETEEIRVLAVELSEMLTKKVGPTEYMTAHSQVSRHQNNLRQERRKRRAFEAVVNPAKRQEKREKTNERRKENNKRKIDTMRPSSGRANKRRK